MGLIASVYRNADDRDCTLHGWSSKAYGFDSVCVVNADGPFEPDEKHPAVLVVRHRTMNTLHAVSKHHFDNKTWTMMGGNFLYTSDSRFGELCRKLLEEGGVRSPSHFSYGAVPIHDRVEG
jgi:hypothetical protein